MHHGLKIQNFNYGKLFLVSITPKRYIVFLIWFVLVVPCQLYLCLDYMLGDFGCLVIVKLSVCMAQHI